MKTKEGFSFIIISRDFEFIPQIIDSIRTQNIPSNQHEIIVVGGKYKKTTDYICVPFEDHKFPVHISAKKNIGTEFTRYDKCVYMHDYIILNDGWYEGYQKFGYDWDLCMNVILNLDGERFQDWVSFDNPMCKFSNRPWFQKEKWCPKGIERPYTPALENYDSPNPYFLIPGYYWAAKQSWMTKHYIREDLCHCDGEDVEFSLRIRCKNPIYKMNKFSAVRTLKKKVLTMRDAIL